MAPRRTRHSITWIARVLALVLATLPLAAACGGNDGTACYPDDWRYCDCPNGTRGYTQCAAQGAAQADARADVAQSLAYGACDCSGNVPAGAGILVEASAPDTAAADGGLLPFLAGCTNDADCASNLCFAFNAFGPHCSHSCTKDTDCEAPSPGCSNKGVCKLH